MENEFDFDTILNVKAVEQGKFMYRLGRVDTLRYSIKLCSQTVRAFIGARSW